ncbi:MAG: sulfate ABC transporter permease subunit CysT [Thermoleophilia bacterium]|nr:sulfate ABC transporter permease subunit CysT [Thermoleophilia bacterium]
MAEVTAPLAQPLASGARRQASGAPLLAGALSALYLGVVVLAPLVALAFAAAGDRRAFWEATTNPEAVASIELTLAVSAVVVAIDVAAGTAIAWVLTRDEFRGRRLVDALVDLPLALPTIVAGLTLLALYGPRGGLGVNVAFTRAGIVLALLFVTLPFVVRTVQPVLGEIDRELEEAAASLGAGRLATFRRVVLPAIVPAILSGVALAFARAIGEFGAVVLISGNLPFKTEVASVYVFGRLNAGDRAGAAAISMLLLALSFATLLLVAALRRRVTRHER